MEVTDRVGGQFRALVRAVIGRIEPVLQEP
jgi:hypothetical protein